MSSSKSSTRQRVNFDPRATFFKSGLPNCQLTRVPFHCNSQTQTPAVLYTTGPLLIFLDAKYLGMVIPLHLNSPLSDLFLFNLRRPVQRPVDWRLAIAEKNANKS